MNQEKRLESWKEIEAYLKRDFRTLRRWEKEEGLPIHRHGHKSRASVYAYPSEIDAWRASRNIVPEPPPPLPLWKTLLAPHRSLAVGVTLALCLVMVGNGIRPQTASAQGTAPVARQVWAPGGYDRVSVDGRYAPFTDWSLKGMGVHDFETGTNLYIATGDQDGEFPVLSPDNRLMVYTYFDRARNGWVLRLTNVRGDPRPRDLIKGEPAGYVLAKGWTPDGKQVLFTEQAKDGIWQISLVPVADGTRHVLKSLKWGRPEASISPDGRWIAYSTPAEGQPNADIFVLATDGSSEAAVVQHPADDGGMVWSSDGGHILFTSDRTGSPSLWAIRMKDGKPAGSAELVKADFGASLLGMGRNGRLFYWVGSGDYLNVYRADLGPDGKAARAPVIATDSFVNTNKGGDISPDGKIIAYYSFRPQPTVVVKSLETGEERVVPTPRTVDNEFLRGPSWFPDSQSVLITTRDNSRPNQIWWRINVNTGRAEEILRGLPGNLFRPAPLGNVFYSKEGRDLVRRDLDSGEVTKRPYTGGWFSVSPDGKQIAYYGSRAPAERYIAIVPASGGEPRIVHRSPSNGGPESANTLEWSADQKYLFFVSGNSDHSLHSFEGPPYQSTIWRIPSAGGAAERVGITMNGNIKSPFLHPDGKRLFFTVEGADPSEVWALENFLPKANKK